MIHREHHDAVAVLRLQHGKANAIDIDLLEGLRSHLDELATDGNTRAVVLTGTGSMFSAGVELFRVLEGGADYIGEFLPALSASLRHLLELPLPVVASINGHAIAGGCVLAAACDHRVMTETGARIGLTELAVGVPFPQAALELMRGLLPAQVLNRMVCGSETMLPDAALSCGLVDELAPTDAVTARAIEVAGGLGSIPRAAFAVTKNQLRQPILDAIERGAARFDAEVLRIWQSEPAQTAIRGFLARTLRKKA